MLIKKYNTYSDIPTIEKNSALRHYKDSSFTDIIFQLSNYKCTFCESNIENVSYINVEHFYPKSLYPKFAFKWTNLIPACERCNSKKSDFDTKTLPFVNPMKDDPDAYFDYNDCRICVSPTAPDLTKAANTIEHCNLRRTSLTRIYAELLPGIYDLANLIEDTIIEYNKLNQRAAKNRVLNRIVDSMENIIAKCKPGMEHASFIRCMLLKNKTFTDAVDLINANLTTLGLMQPLKIK
ncbi:HNH endonuclease [Pedobacter panaciterrae]